MVINHIDAELFCDSRSSYFYTLCSPIMYTDPTSSLRYYYNSISLDTLCCRMLSDGINFAGAGPLGSQIPHSIAMFELAR